MTNKAATFPTARPDIGSLELTEEYIRLRAYRFYEQRGGQHGHDLEDWLEAEAEIFGRRKRSSTSTTDQYHNNAVAAAA